ncbi:hypothetical protein HOO65_060573 [Ceratocystis lukuohia]|uniref:Uncharacterized protein n=1 Tax=Ceratocystis lukuohia TaxID=2019550 RepID=A0ABR4MEN7_9PEZI
MPSFMFNPFGSSHRSGPRMVNPMLSSLPKPVKSQEPAPCLPSLPDLSSSSDGDSLIEAARQNIHPVVRPGKLKTIGGSDSADKANKDDTYKVPDVDFGPTFNFAAKDLPKDKLRAIVGDAYYDSRSGSTDDSKHKSMNEQWRRLNSSAGMASRPGTVASHYRNISRESLPGHDHPHLAHRRRSSSNLMASLPAANPNSAAGVTPSRTPPRSGTALSQTPQRLLTPESIEQAPHSRSNSYSHVHPHSHSHSHSLSHSHIRKPSAESRPYSRAATLIEYPTRPELVSNLSAREQAHVARLTGGPLISLVTTPSRQSPSSAVGGTSTPGRGHAHSPSVGLVGAIDARQREKEQLKASGAYNPSVAYALRERQQQMAMQQMQIAQAQSLALQNQQMQMQFQAQWEQQQIQQQQQMMMAGSQGMATPYAMSSMGGVPMGYEAAPGMHGNMAVPSALSNRRSMYGMSTNGAMAGGMEGMGMPQQRGLFVAAGARGY